MVGPSGVGKRTLITYVIKKYGELFKIAHCLTTNEIAEQENPLVYKKVDSFDSVSIFNLLANIFSSSR